MSPSESENEQPNAKRARFERRNPCDTGSTAISVARILKDSVDVENSENTGSGCNLNDAAIARALKNPEITDNNEEAENIVDIDLSQDILGIREVDPEKPIETASGTKV